MTTPIRSGRLLTVACAVAACDAPTAKSVPNPKKLDAAFVQVGTTRRLNISPAAEATVRFRDPIQGAKRTDGSCTFADIFMTPNAPKPRKGYRFTVGEWNTETCAGTLYYFDVPPRKTPPKAFKADTLFAPVQPAFE